MVSGLLVYFFIFKFIGVCISLLILFRSIPFLRMPLTVLLLKNENEMSAEFILFNGDRMDDFSRIFWDKRQSFIVCHQAKSKKLLNGYR